MEHMPQALRIISADINSIYKMNKHHNGACFNCGEIFFNRQLRTVKDNYQRRNAERQSVGSQTVFPCTKIISTCAVAIHTDKII